MNLLNRFLNRFEEIFISFLMAGATLLIFTAVVHRYLCGLPIPYVQDFMLSLNFSWSQELCIIMFVWMAKFGAAYGVRTGIHVGVDVLVKQFDQKKRNLFILFSLMAGAFFTGCIATLGAHFVWQNGAHHAWLELTHQPFGILPEGPTTPDLEWPTWMVYSAIPLGSGLMCYRFIQNAWSFYHTGSLPSYNHAHVEGLHEAPSGTKVH